MAVQVVVPQRLLDPGQALRVEGAAALQRLAQGEPLVVVNDQGDPVAVAARTRRTAATSSAGLSRPTRTFRAVNPPSASSSSASSPAAVGGMSPSPLLL